MLRLLGMRICRMLLLHMLLLRYCVVKCCDDTNLFGSIAYFFMLNIIPILLMK